MCVCAFELTGTVIMCVCVCHTESSEMAASFACCFLITDFAERAQFC